MSASTVTPFSEPMICVQMHASGHTRPSFGRFVTFRRIYVAPTVLGPQLRHGVNGGGDQGGGRGQHAEDQPVQRQQLVLGRRVEAHGGQGSYIWRCISVTEIATANNARGDRLRGLKKKNKGENVFLQRSTLMKEKLDCLRGLRIHSRG